MHEVSLAGGILKIVEDAQAREGFVSVTRLAIGVGVLAGVEVRALRFALDGLKPGTVLDGAVIEINEEVATAWCLGCDSSVAIASRLDACPNCGSHRLQPTSGTELRVTDLLVRDAVPPETITKE